LHRKYPETRPSDVKNYNHRKLRMQLNSDGGNRKLRRTVKLRLTASVVKCTTLVCIHACVFVSSGAVQGCLCEGEPSCVLYAGCGARTWAGGLAHTALTLHKCRFCNASGLEPRVSFAWLWKCAPRPAVRTHSLCICTSPHRPAPHPTDPLFTPHIRSSTPHVCSPPHRPAPQLVCPTKAPSAPMRAHTRTHVRMLMHTHAHTHTHRHVHKHAVCGPPQANRGRCRCGRPPPGC